MKFDKNLAGDFWGGLAAMLVALPSAIAFGVTIYSPMGSSYAAQGALAGILGVTALGLLAPAFGGTDRLITTPSTPAAAVLSAFVIEFLSHDGSRLESVLLMVALLGLLAGTFQFIFGAIGLGRLIKYMPYPVLSGYSSGVGLYMIASQVPKFLGVPKEIHFWESLISMSKWQWQGMVVGIVTMVVMLVAPKITKVVPAVILALVCGVLAYFGLGLLDGSLLVLPGNKLVVGTLGGGDGNFIEVITSRWSAVSNLTLADFGVVAMPALTLAILLSIDTLKTCVVLDALTRSRHDSNRELIGQGIGNIASSIIGGIPGSGMSGATLVNLSSGAQSRLSGIVEGALALIAFLVFRALVAWVPVASLAGILIVIGTRMMDLHTLRYLKSRATVLDFVVIVAVVIVALTINLVAATGTGIVLAILLFVREQIGGRVVRRKAYGNATFSKQIRPREEMEILIQQGGKTVIFELQGSLFFGTTDQLYTALEPELKKRTYVILDLRRVQSVDVTATHMLGQIKDTLAERNGFLICSQIPRNLPSGRDMKEYLDQVGLVRPDSPVKVFGEIDEAIEWVENRILAGAAITRGEEKPLNLAEIELFKERKEGTLSALESCMEQRSFEAGKMIFARGDAGSELFLIRRGEVRILLPVDETHSHHISTFGRGAFFGEMSFLDGKPRSASAIAYSDTDLYVLPRKTFNQYSEEHKKIALNLLEGLAKVLAARLRYADMEIHALET